MPFTPLSRVVGVLCAALAIAGLWPQRAVAETPASAARIELVTQTLPNGLQVIYAPVRNAPVAHVRVVYHVGSRNERPDRQGFAHLFEHMMFRGSRHVAPEQHMKLIGNVGGESNAFTSFDQTAYVNTLPANQLALALWLEADRMASFTVSDAIFQTERKVVAEEWRMRYANQPYGPLFADLMKTVFQDHAYRWTPIGDMEQLGKSTSAELQDFFNTYYVPNNATLILAGDIDIETARNEVERYFGWIPPGAEPDRSGIQQETEQVEPREREIHRRNVPVPVVLLGFRTPGYRHEDQEALELLAGVLGGGASSRLSQRLVNGPDPVAADASAGNMALEDHGVFTLDATVLPGNDPATVEAALLQLLDEVRTQGVNADELNTARTQAIQAIIRSRQTASSIAGQLAEAAVFGGDVHRVNQAIERLERVTPDDLRRVAGLYLRPERQSRVSYLPDPLGERSASPATQAALAEAVATAPVNPSTRPIAQRDIAFPSDYPAQPPIVATAPAPEFAKGQTLDIDGVKTVVLEDDRLPLASVTLILRRGGHSEPAGKTGLAGLTAEMLQRGAAGLSFAALWRDLEARGIQLNLTNEGDTTRLTIAAPADQLEHALLRAKQILRQPDFPPDEFERFKAQAASALAQELSDPSELAQRQIKKELWGDSPLGRSPTPDELATITLEDVRAFYETIYTPADALLIFSGDVTPARGEALARQLLADWPRRPLAEVGYDLPPAPTARKIVIVDNPAGKQSAIRMGVPAYSLHSEEKFAGSVAGRILSDGIDSRLGRVVRAERGLAYGVAGYFMPTRQAGQFIAFTDTDLPTTAAAVEAIFQVLEQMRQTPVSEAELKQTTRRIAGSMVMEMQTIGQQASRRADVELNGYPLNYYDVYPQRIAQVSAEEVQAVMRRHVDPARMTVVVVAPAEQVRAQLEPLGEVIVVQPGGE